MLGLLISIRFVFPLRPSSEVSKEWQIDSAVRAAEQKMNEAVLRSVSVSAMANRSHKVSATLMLMITEVHMLQVSVVLRPTLSETTTPLRVETRKKLCYKTRIIKQIILRSKILSVGAAVAAAAVGLDTGGKGAD